MLTNGTDAGGAIARKRLGKPFDRNKGTNGHVVTSLHGSQHGYSAAQMLNALAERGVDVSGLQRSFSSTDFLSPTFASTIRMQLHGDEELTRPIEQNAWLYACALVRTSAVSSVPLVLFRSGEPDAAPVPESDPLVRLFAKPNRLRSWPRFARCGQIARIVTGEDWWFLAGPDGKAVELKSSGQIAAPTQIIQVPGNVVSYKLETNRASRDYGLPKTFEYSTAGGQTVEFGAHAVLPFFELEDPYNPFRGIGPVEVLERLLGIHFQAERYLEGITSNSGDPGGWLTAKESSREAANELQKKIDDQTDNTQAKGRYVVLHGDVTFLPNPVAPKDMEFANLFAHVIRAICGALGVPPEVIGEHEYATYSNMQEAYAAVWTGPTGVVPYLRSIEEVLNRDFFPRLEGPQSEYRARFDLSNVDALRVDNSDNIVKAANVARSMGLALNDVLPHFGVDEPIEGGDEVFDPYAGLLDDEEPTDGETTPDAEGAPAAVGTDESLTGQDVQTQLLNGAQIAQAVSIVAQVTSGELPRDAGVAMLATFFGLTPEQAEQIMGSAGTEKPTTPNPNPSATPSDPNGEPPTGDNAATSGAADGPPKSDDKDDEEPASKSLPLLTRARTPLHEKSQRVEYWNALELKRAPGDALLKRDATKYLRQYEQATIRRIESFAENGTRAHGAKDVVKRLGLSPRSPIAVERADFEAWITREINPDDHMLDVLTVNKAEWEAKMQAIFDPSMRKIVAAALEDVAQEIGSVSIGVQDPRVLQALIRRELRLVEGVTSKLARDVKVAIADVFKDTSTIGDLQLAIREKLPEVTENVRGVFMVGSSRVDLQACKLEYSIVSPK